MLKLRLKRTGRKRYPTYKIVIMESSNKRDGRVIDIIGFYNPITKELQANDVKIIKWLIYGAKPTSTVFNLLKKACLIK